MKSDIIDRADILYLAEYIFQVQEWEDLKQQAKEHRLSGLKNQNIVRQNSDVRDTKKILANKLAVSTDTASRIIQIHEKASEELKETPRNPGTRFKGGGGFSGGYQLAPPEEDIPTLAELGLDKKTTSYKELEAKSATLSAIPAKTTNLRFSQAGGCVVEQLPGNI